MGKIFCYAPPLLRRGVRRKRLNKLKYIVQRMKLTYCDSDPVPMSEIVNRGEFVDFWNIILKIVNLSIGKRVIPSSEKQSLIKPTLKGSLDSQSLSSYRPISNLTFLSKIIENIILDQMISFLLETGVLVDEQSAYRQLYSTETAICSIVNNIILSMDEGKCGILVLLDLSAAFDTVVHSLLLEDLERIGMVGDALEYLKDYLQNRTYCVQIGKVFSEPELLGRGVPQGSVLGPVLFCIYTIELAHLLQRHGVVFKLFADDTQFYIMVTDIDEIERRLTAIMDDIRSWMAFKQLKLNEDKTECLIVGKKQNLERLGNLNNLRLYNTTVEVKKSVKDLGVILDCNMSLKDQINKVVRVVGYHLRNIGFVRKYIDSNTTKMLVHNYVISRLD